MKTLTAPIITLLASLVFLSGCYTTPTQEGALWGGAIGAAAGQIIGRDRGSTMAGAGIGALAGALVNDQIHQSYGQGYGQGYNQGYGQSYNRNHSQTRFNPFAPVSGYYNPPNTGNAYTSYHNNSYNANASAAVNGRPVTNPEDLHVLRETAEISWEQQELDHRQAMDRARQQTHELRTYSDIARDVIWETRGWGW